MGQSWTVRGAVPAKAWGRVRAKVEVELVVCSLLEQVVVAFAQVAELQSRILRASPVKKIILNVARDAAMPPEGYFDLGKMLKKLIEKSVPVKVCGTCKTRCGIHKGEPYFEGAKEAKMTEPAEWIKEADKVITF